MVRVWRESYATCVTDDSPEGGSVPGTDSSGDLLTWPPEVQEVLAVLEHHWGTAYLFGFAGGMFTARRRDSQGSPLGSATAEGLRLEVRRDYIARPVPREGTVTGA
jgi:hypothetical protein